MEQVGDTQLLGVRGSVKNRRLTFMLDSGASCNFISLDQIRTLGLRFNNCIKHSVRLANGGKVNTVGSILLKVKFSGGYVYEGTFYILDCQVPLILGMQFFSSVQPQIDWGSRSIFVKSGDKYVQLHSVQMPNKGAQQAEKQPKLPVDNKYDVLSVEEGSVYPCPLDSSDVSGGLDVAPSMTKTCQKRCKGCTRILAAGSTHHCDRCLNHSFKHQKHDLVTNRASSVQPLSVQQGVSGCRSVVGGQQQVATSDQQSGGVELCTFRQFVRGGKKQQYLNYGLIQLEQQSDSNNVDNVQLNFTHRATLGGGDDADGKHGSLQDLATQQLDYLKYQYSSVFQEPQYPVDRSQCGIQFEHSIPLKDEGAAPPKRKLYPLDNEELVELKKQIQEFLDSNRIEPSNGPYGAPILFAKKKDGGLRMCIDYRMLNQQTQNDVFPLPRIDEMLQRLDGACVFSKLDLRDGYHQIPMKQSDRVKTAFSCRYGTYQFTVMPFGLSSAPSTFQRMMNRVFFELLDNGVVCYLDDLLIYSKSVEEHRVLLDKVFSILEQNKLYIKESKCHLFLEKVNFLGHVVDKNGLSLESGKIDAVSKWPEPTNVNQVQQFLGLCNYYRRFVLRFSELAGPLTKLTRKGIQFAWQKEQQVAFDKLKQSLCSAPTLKIFDPSLETRVVCDASNFCCGAVLEQLVNGRWHPIEYYSKRLSQAERNYSATDREFVAIKLSLERWRQFLVGKKFVLLTDHAALTYLNSTATVSRRNARWLEFLSQFDFEIKHIKGRENVVADALSRIPGSEQLDTLQLCSISHTLGVKHCLDLPAKSCSYGMHDQQCFSLNSVLTIHENDTFLQQLKEEQQQAVDKWYLDKVQLAKSGSSTFQFRNGILCKLVGDTFCPIVPTRDSKSVQIILHDLHSSSLAGHLGQRKLKKLVQKRFYWKQMIQSIDSFCRQCAVCQANKTSTQRPIGVLQPVENPSKPFEHIQMDFVMNLPQSSRGFDAIFTVIDRFSRLVRFIPCHSNIDAVGASKLLFEHWICRFGMPSKIISDRDVRFQSKFWQALMQQLDCRIAMSTSYHPQTDGLTERFHRSVEQVLRCYCSHQQEQWCELLSQCEFALNSSYQDAIANIPFYVVFGVSPSLPLDHTMSSLQLPSVVDTVSARRSVQHQVATSLEQSQQRMKGLADPHRRDVSFQQGDRVWLSTGNLPLRLGSRKLAAKWAGPFQVIDVVASQAYRLRLPDSWRIHDVFHASQLKPTHGEVCPTEPVQLEDSSEEFEVDKILAVRVTRGKSYYLIRWKGFSSFDDSWEPEENLQNAGELLKTFKQQQKRE